MLNFDVKRKINTLRDILVGKVPDPKSQVEQITIALIYKFMDDMDLISAEFGERQFFTGEYEKYAWSNIMNPQVSGTEKAFLYMEGIEKMQVNPALPALFRSIFRGAFLPYRDPETLTMFLKEINDFSYENSEDLGNAYEYLLSIMGSQGDAGQFRTPRHIIDMIVEIVEPTKTDKILDPACGTAGFLISAYKYIMEHNQDKDGNSTLTADEREHLTKNFAGYDISQDMVRLSRVNMYLHNFLEPNISEYDTLTSIEKWDDTFDVILANPPFMTPKGGIKPHNRFQIQAKRSEVLFVDYIAEHLNTGGRAGVIVPEGIVFQSANAYKDLRKMLVDNNFLYAVISLPAGVFNPYSGVKTSILLFDRVLAAKTDKILFVKIQNDGFDLGAQRREIKDNDIPRTKDLIKKYKAALQQGSEFALSEYEKEFATLAAKKDIKKQDYILVGDRYKETVVHNSKWPMVELGSICQTSSGGTPKAGEHKYYKNGDIPWIRSGDVAQGFIYSSEIKITELALKESSAKLFPTNTVLVAMYGATAGQVGILKIEAATNQAVCGVLPNDKFIPEFLFYILKAKREYLISLSSGGAQPNISQSIIKSLKIPLPPLSVQEQIVAEIESYQKIIDGAKQVIDNYKPTIKIDPEWEMVELGDNSLFIIESGGTPDSKKEEYWNGNINWATLVDLPAEDGISIISNTQRKITELGLKNSNAKLMPVDTILVSTRATIGRVGISKVEISTNQGFKNIIIKDKNKVNTYFCALMITRLKDRMIQLASGGTFKEISKTNFASLRIPLPPLEVQKQIVKQIDEEQAIVNQNKRLIEIFEQKIKGKIAEVWGEGTNL
jgi:type I restriction enzyme M protein